MTAAVQGQTFKIPSVETHTHVLRSKRQREELERQMTEARARREALAAHSRSLSGVRRQALTSEFMGDGRGNQPDDTTIVAELKQVALDTDRTDEEIAALAHALELNSMTSRAAYERAEADVRGEIAVAAGALFVEMLPAAKTLARLNEQMFKLVGTSGWSGCELFVRNGMPSALHPYCQPLLDQWLQQAEMFEDR